MLLVLQLIGASLTPGFMENSPLQVLISVIFNVLVAILTRVAHEERGIYPKNLIK